MSHISTNPRVAWAMAYESGIRTQAMADLIETQEAPVIIKTKRRRKYQDAAENDKGEEVVLTYTREQISASQDKPRKGGPGAAHGAEYTPVYSVIRRMERENPVIAAAGHWLCLSDEGAANQYLDDVADTVLTRLIVSTPNWKSFRRSRKDRVAALVQACMVQERNDMDGSRPQWGPAEICGYVSKWLGVSMAEQHFQRDGWDDVWQQIAGIIRDLESEAMAPITETAKMTNHLMRAA